MGGALAVPERVVLVLQYPLIELHLSRTIVGDCLLENQLLLRPKQTGQKRTKEMVVCHGIGR